MFARIVDCQAKEGLSAETGARLNKEVLPILQKQPGFVDFIVLSDKIFPERFVCISLWQSREDAHHYHQHNYDMVIKMLQPQLETLPTVETFSVSSSTAHRILNGRVTQGMDVALSA